MKRKLSWLFAAILFSILQGSYCLGAEIPADVLMKAALDFSATIEQKKLKKISIVPFSDLQNKRTQISAYITEKFSVQLSKSKRSFSLHAPSSVSTNLGPISVPISEADKVDGFVTGTIVALNEALECTIKLFAAPSAELLAANVYLLPRTPSINQVLELDGSMDWSQTFAELLRIRKGSEALGGLLIHVQSVDYVQRTQDDVKLRLIVTFVNTNKIDGLSFSFKTAGYNWGDAESHILSARKDLYELSHATGLSTVRYSASGSTGGFVDLAPLTSSNATLVYKLSQRIGDAPGDFPPYRFQAEVYIGQRKQEGVKDVKLHNFVFDLPSANGGSPR